MDTIPAFFGRFNIEGVVDTHTHLASSGGSERLDDVDRLVQSLDLCGIEKAIVLPFPHLFDYGAEHDAIAQAQDAHPGRIFGCACVPPQVGEHALRDELSRCFNEFRFRAIKFHPLHHWGGPSSAFADLLFQAAREYHVPIICHTGSGLPWSSPTQLIPAARKYSDVTIIAAHSGQNLFASDALVAVSECDNIFLDSSWTSPFWLAKFFDIAGSERVMFSSDLVINSLGEVAKWQSLGLSTADLTESLVSLPGRIFSLAPGA